VRRVLRRWAVRGIIGSEGLVLVRPIGFMQTGNIAFVCGQQ